MSDNRSNSGSKNPNQENYRNNGTQTPVYKNPAPMPPIKPAKAETNKG